MQDYLMRGAAVLALLGATLPAMAQEAVKPVPPRAVANSCPTPAWPKEALRFEQEGEVTLAFLVSEQGAVQESKVAASSGFPLLDAAAREGLAKCGFTPGTQDGKPVAAWTQTKFAWSLKPGAPTALERTYATGGSDIKEMVAGMADKGDPNAVMEMTKAAVKGDVAAQLWTGRRYEEGKGVPASTAAAAVWYGKAAAAGNSRAKAALARLQEQGGAVTPAAAAR